MTLVSAAAAADSSGAPPGAAATAAAALAAKSAARGERKRARRSLRGNLTLSTPPDAAAAELAATARVERKRARRSLRGNLTLSAPSGAAAAALAAAAAAGARHRRSASSSGAQRTRRGNLSAVFPSAGSGAGGAGRGVSRRHRSLRLDRRRKQPCLFFNRFGRCKVAEAATAAAAAAAAATADGKVPAETVSLPPGCPYEHDPVKVAVCRRFLNGSCPRTADECRLTHSTEEDRLPLCRSVLRGGECRRPGCAYAHRAVEPGAGVCEDFAFKVRGAAGWSLALLELSCACACVFSTAWRAFVCFLLVA